MFEKLPHTVAKEIKLLIFADFEWSLLINGEEVKGLEGFSISGNRLTGVKPYELRFDPQGVRDT